MNGFDKKGFEVVVALVYREAIQKYYVFKVSTVFAARVTMHY